MLRQKGQKTPCVWCPKIPVGEPQVPESAIELSEKNLAAYQHYQECRAVADFPADAIVRRNAGVIRAAEDAADRVRQTRAGLMALGTIMRG